MIEYETYQVILDIIKNSPCYNAFLITVDVPEIYMQQFWFTITKVKKSSFYQFDLDNKKCQIDVELFWKILLTTLTDEIKKSEAYQTFHAISIGLVPLKKRRGKGEIGKKATVTPKNKSPKKKSSKKKSSIIADDNIVLDLDQALQLGASISKTDAEIAKEQRRVHETHEHIISEKLSSDEGSDEDTPRVTKKKALESSQKLKGIEMLPDAAQLEIDTQKAIKAIKRESKRQPQPGGSSKGAEVPDEIKDITEVLAEDDDWGSDNDENILINDKDIKEPEVDWVYTDDEANDNDDNEEDDDDQSIDIAETDEERTESDNDDHVMVDTKKIVTEKAKEEKADEEQKGDEQAQDDQAKDDQVGGSCLSPLVDVLVSVIPPQTTLIPTLTIPLPAPPITSEALTIITTVPDLLPTVIQRLLDLERNFETWTKVDHYDAIEAPVQANLINEISYSDYIRRIQQRRYDVSGPGLHKKSPNLLQVKIDDPNITMEEYIRLEEEKAHRHGKVYNWETPMYGKIWYDEDVHDLRYVETEFPAIVFNDTLTSEVALSCKPMDLKGKKLTMLDSTCLGLRKKYRLSLKNDMPPRDKQSLIKSLIRDVVQKNTALIAQSSFTRAQPSSKATESLSKLELKQLLFGMVDKIRSYMSHDKHQDLCDALLNLILLNEVVARGDVNPDIVLRKQDRNDDQDPTGGSNQRKEKKRRKRTNAESSKKSSGSKKSTKDVEEPTQDEGVKHTDQPQSDDTSKNDNSIWFKQPPRPETLDPDWNTVKAADDLQNKHGLKRW
ncbi:hypothetical protein Tco_1243041 [Tanacetum coccineum]